MAYQAIFKRYEIKYLISQDQKAQLLKAMEPYMALDKYGRTTIRNIYFDTENYRLIRRSIEKPVYKEKLRIRSYGPATPDSTVFVELKKKYRRIVYKRRVSMPYSEVDAFMQKSVGPKDPQIQREIHYFLDYYAPLSPAMYLCYDRQAFYAKDDDSFRITFDDNVFWREHDLTLSGAPQGERLLPEDRIIMEVKTPVGIPLWLSDMLTQEHIYKTPFSKYGNAYIVTQQRLK